MKRLLPLSAFAHVFDPLKGQKVGIIDGFGNPGDRLLDCALRHLLEDFGIGWRTINPVADPPGQAHGLDVLLLAGGGSMGGPRECQIHRERGLATGIPCIVMPQSFHGPEDCSRYRTVYVRERASLNLYPRGVLAPDLALGYRFPAVPAPQYERGVFLRAAGHAKFADRAGVDPAAICYTPEDYFSFVAAYAHVITDRLHLAITAMGLGRRVTLLPVSYHKNRAMWEDWLRELGCEWADEPPTAQ